MALMKCPACKSEVENQIAICPTCGYEFLKQEDENHLSKIKEKNLADVTEKNVPAKVFNFSAVRERIEDFFFEAREHIKDHLAIYLIGATALVIAFCMIMAVVTSGGFDDGGNNDTIRCKVCYKTFDEGTSNANSIHRTNMCKKCYENYKWTQNAIDGLN